MKFNENYFQPIKGVEYWSANKKVKVRLFGEAFAYDEKILEVFNDPVYFVEAQIMHWHGFEGERHNVHTKRFKYLMPALEKYYKNVWMLDDIKSCQRAKI